MKKITLISISTIIIVALLVIVLTSCDNTVASIPNSFYPIESGDIDNITHYNVLVDSETGVEYIYIHANYKAAMTPRYNDDGTLYIYEGVAND